MHQKEKTFWLYRKGDEIVNAKFIFLKKILEKIKVRTNNQMIKNSAWHQEKI